MEASPAADHPVWASLIDLLRETDGETLATKCLLVNEELTPFEFLSAAASQCFTIEPWALRIELFRACAVAVRMGGSRVSGFVEAIFSQLVNIPATTFDDEYCCQLIDLYIDLLVSHTQQPTTPMLAVIYDPLLTRVQNTNLARAKAKRILTIVEQELQTLTVQEILLHGAFVEKQQGLEDDANSEAANESLSEWDDTSDSTDSSVDRYSGKISDKLRGLVPMECSAAVCFFLAPNLLEPNILSSWGKFKWAQPWSRYLLRNTPVKSLAARRGFELFCAFDSICAENDVDEVVEMVVAAVGFAVELQSLPCRNAVQDFISSLYPDTARVQVLVRIAEDSAQIQPRLRAWAVDMLTKQVMKSPNLFAQQDDVKHFVLEVLQQDNQDLELYSACFALLRAAALVGACSSVDAGFASKVVFATRRIQVTMKEMEQEIDKDMEFQLRMPQPPNDDMKPIVDNAVPQNSTSRQAELGKARLVCSFADQVLELWKDK